MSKNKNGTADRIVQEHCIDLPGESVQCWRSGDAIKIVLRKHRDVIFDLKLGKGKTYAIHATNSDFYCARDKKIVLAARNGRVTFVDGERLHLWLTRGFKGSLILQQEGKILLKVTPSELDPQKYDNDPKTKVAPIIISLGHSHEERKTIANDKAETLLKASGAKNIAMPYSNVIPRPSTALVQLDCPVICVVDGNKKGMPEKILQLFSFKTGGGDSGLVDIDPNDIATRNWIWGQVAGTAAYAADNWEWLRASIGGNATKGFKLVCAKVHYVKGKIRFYFSGYTKLNKVFGAGGFGPGNNKIVNIFAGVGKTDSTFLAGAKGVAGSFKGFAAVSLIFGAGTAYAEWKDDLGKDGYDLAAALIMSVVKTILVAVIVVAIVAFVVALVMLAAGASMSVLLIGALSVAASFVVNYGVEALDKKLGSVFSRDTANGDGLSSVLTPMLRSSAKAFNESWNHLMEKFPKDYQWIEF